MENRLTYHGRQSLIGSVLGNTPSILQMFQDVKIDLPDYEIEYVIEYAYWHPAGTETVRYFIMLKK